MASRRTEARRQELLTSAIRCIQRVGAGASMEQMAAEAGVTKPVLYRYFHDKSELYQAIVERYVAEVSSALRESLSTDGNPRVVLVAGIDAYLSLVEREPEIYRFLMQRARFEQRPAATIDNFIQRLGQEIGVVTGERLQQAGADTGGAEVWGHAIVGMVNAAADWWVGRPVLSRRRLVAYLADLLWAGFAGVPQAPTRTRTRGKPRATVVALQGGKQ